MVKIFRTFAGIIFVFLSVSVSGQINLVSDPTPPHGSFAFADSAITLTMAQDNWVSITNPTNTLFTNYDAEFLTFAGDSVTIDITGDYISITSISFSGTASDEYEFEIFKNNAETGMKMQRTTSQTDVGNIGLPVYLELERGDDLTLKIRNTASDDDATIISCSWIIYKLH